MTNRTFLASFFLIWGSIAYGDERRIEIPHGIKIPPDIQIRLPTTEMLECFEKGSHRYAEMKVSYRAFIPPANGKEKPLFIWLHGHGQLELEVEDAQLNYIEYLIDPTLGKDNFFVVAVQCPRDQLWNTSNGNDALAAVVDLVEHMEVDYPEIDKDRVYAVGISSGGSACWELAKRHPGFLAAMAPLGGSSVSRTGMDNIATLPVWAFHSEVDYAIPVERSEETMARYHSVGGMGTLTIIDSASHDCWQSAFEDFKLKTWLLQQRKGKPARWRVKTRARLLLREYTPQQILLQFGVPISLVVTVIVYFSTAAIKKRFYSGGA